VSKKVIIIRNAYSYDFGGGERFPVFLAESLTSQQIEPLIISRNNTLLKFAEERGIRAIRGWWWSQQRWNGWRIVLFPTYAIWQAVLYCWYRRLFAQEKPDVVHIQSKDDFIAATYAASHYGAIVVWTDHADLKHVWRNITVPIKNPVGKWVYRAAQKTRAITVVSKSELKEVSAHLPINSPIRSLLKVVYNGCADVLNEYPHKNLGDKISFIMASRLVTDKGIGEAIEAFKRLHQRYPKTELRIAGDGPEREKFIKQAKGTDGIIFIGHQNDPYKAISEADIFLQPTYHEGFSVVLVEASMLEKPIIATAVGGNVEIIHNNETGLLVPAKSADLLAKAMEKIYTDKTLRTTLATNARKQYENQFVFDVIVREGFIPLYEAAR
jgi:glycosyltransferase involved in cell wall biosynthesis